MKGRLRALAIRLFLAFTCAACVTPRRANLTGVYLQGVNLTDACLVHATLAGANLTGAHLELTQGLTCIRLVETENWASAFRDETLACGAEIPPYP